MRADSTAAESIGGAKLVADKGAEPLPEVETTGAEDVVGMDVVVAAAGCAVEGSAAEVGAPDKFPVGATPLVLGRTGCPPRAARTAATKSALC